MLALLAVFIAGTAFGAAVAGWLLTSGPEDS